MRVSGVMFDLGGTLFQHLPPATTTQNLALALATQGVSDPPQAQLASYHGVRAAVEQEFVGRRFFLHRELVLTAVTRYGALLRDAGIAVDGDALGRAFYALQRTAVTEQLRPREDAAHVLQTLREWGYQVGIVSNIDEDYLGPLLAREPDLAACHFVLSSEYCRSCKPDAAIFQRALARSGLPPEQILVVGDSLTNDVRGAYTMGMRSAWLICDQLEERIAPVRGALAADSPGSLVGPLRAPDLFIDALVDLLGLLRVD
ncbi:MAG: HAD family hydrolase [Pseudomonadota bacterium]